MAPPERYNVLGQPWRFLRRSEDEGSLPHGHRMNVTKVFNERTSPHCPPKLSGINQKWLNSSEMATGNATLYEMFPIGFQPNYLSCFKGQTCFL